ncbi:MAG: AzlD domain-containing protein [Lachnospiraceae bacterium]|nr:AzlD domain-containing protein [Lachnospiraceae bacterium]MBR6697065.1 AzlD domain-containing protein [Lachnospiraceae bacterium]
MLSTTQVILSIIVMAVCTFLTRAIPFILFPNNEKIPPIVLYLGKVLPYSVIAMLIIYCVKGVSIFVWPHGLPELIAIAYVIIVHKWRHNLVLSIGGGTVLYMFLIQVAFA